MIASCRASEISSAQTNTSTFDWDLFDEVEDLEQKSTLSESKRRETRFPAQNCSFRRNAEDIFDHIPETSHGAMYRDPHRYLCKHIVDFLPDSSELWNASALYSVRLLLDIDSKSVEDALEAAFLYGRPGNLDGDAHKRVFSIPPTLSKEWEDVSHGGMTVMPDSGRCELAALQHAAAIPMGLRPLGPEEFTQAIEAPSGWTCFHHCAKRQFIGDPTSKEFFKDVDFSHSIVCTAQRTFEREKNDASPRRAFLVCVCSAMQGSALMSLRKYRQIDGPAGGFFDFAVVLRCTVRDVRSNDGGWRTELVRELLDGIPVCMAGKAKLEVMTSNVPFYQRDPVELFLKNYVWVLEDEGRFWAAANGFGFVEAWRGVRRGESSVMSCARHIAAVYCLTPGEGAAAICERNSKFACNSHRLEELASMFPCREIHEKQCTLSSQADHRGQFAEGSVDIRSFAAVIDRICRRARPEVDISRKFVDLGSGEGLAVIAAQQLFEFQSCIGIEIIHELVDRSCKRARSFVDLSGNVPPLFVNGDIFAVESDWSDASVVFCNAATWPAELVEKLGCFAIRLRIGAVLILLHSGRLPQCLFDMFDFHTEAAYVSWHNGPEKLWVFQRV